MKKDVQLDGLHPDPANARQHGARNLDAIKASLQEFGQVSPLVVQAKTGRIIGGNGTYQAMVALGWEHADVAYVDMDDLRATALGIALNRSAELAEWDMGTLSRLLTEIQAADFDVASIGFNDEEVQRLCSQGLDLTHLDADAEPGDPFEDNAAAEGEVAHVKMVQLFFDEAGHARFLHLTDQLSQALECANLSDTVMASVVRAATQVGLSVA